VRIQAYPYYNGIQGTGRAEGPFQYLGASCSDTDGGINTEVKGTISWYENGYFANITDYCIDTTYLKEYYCSGTSNSSLIYNCKNIGPDYTCSNGRCYQIPNSCSDTDGGFKPLVKGTISGYQNGQTYSHTDYCISGTTLKEYSCSGTFPGNSTYNCKNYGPNYICYYGLCRQPSGGSRWDRPLGLTDGSESLMVFGVIAVVIIIAIFGFFKFYAKRI